MSNNTFTLGNLIELAMQMEKNSYEFYEALATRFGSNKEFVDCLDEIKKDELLHYQILTEIKNSLSELRLQAPVTEESVNALKASLEFLAATDPADLKDEEMAVDAIRTLEDVEFDVVMAFVDTDEIDFEFTREYLKNESLGHANRIYKAQQCLG